jgi:hypothetical protein
MKPMLSTELLFYREKEKTTGKRVDESWIEDMVVPERKGQTSVVVVWYMLASQQQQQPSWKRKDLG